MTTRATGVPTATAVLREFLVSHFDLDALEVLCFDLAIDYDILPHRTRIELADGLMEHCAGLGQLRHLAATALARRPSVPDGSALAAVLDQLPTTPAARVRVQVTLDLDMAAWGDRPMREVVEHIARLGGVARLEIHALAAQPGSVRFLIGVPETVLPRLLAAPLPQLASGRWKIVRIEPFFVLPLVVQAAWQAEFRSRAPGRDPQQRKLNFPKRRGCLGGGLGLIALIAIVVGTLAIIAQIPPGSSLQSIPAVPATAAPTFTPISPSTDVPTSTNTPTPTHTHTPTPTGTHTPTPTRTYTPTPTRTRTPTPTRTRTPTPTPALIDKSLRPSQA